MGETSIEWTANDDGTPGKTWNPIRGCSRTIAEGATQSGCGDGTGGGCYAERTAGRFCGSGKPFEGFVRITAKGARWTGKVELLTEHLADPLRWRKPTRVFVNSMSDLFHERLTNEEIAAVFGVMAAVPRHTFIVLTKRARRMREWFEWVEREAAKAGPGAEVMLCVDCADEHDVLGERFVISPPWPLPHVWIGTSVENQAAAYERIPELLRTPAAVRLLSCEPLLVGVDVSPYLVNDLHRMGRDPDRMEIDWVIAGIESGPGARDCDVSALLSLMEQCEAAGVPFFAKQWRGVPGLVTAGKGSHRKPGGIIGAPYVRGKQRLAFPEVCRG